MQANELLKVLQEARNQVISETESIVSVVLEALDTKTDEIKAKQSRQVQFSLPDGRQYKPDIAHADLERVARAMLVERGVYIHGPAGCGKSYLAEQVGALLGKEVVKVVGDPTLTSKAFFGAWTPEGFAASPVVDAVETGKLLFLDEADNLSADMFVALNALVDDSSTIVNPANQKMISKHKEFKVIAAGNTNMRGGNALYLRPKQDASVANRFCFFKTDYDEQMEAQLVSDKELLKQCHEARKALKQKGSHEIVSTRQIVRAERLIEAGFNKSDALDVAITSNWASGLAQSVGL